jgi:hypothetical protein
VLPQVHQVQVIATQLPQVLLDQPAQLVGSRQPVAVGPTFVAMTRSSGYGASAA